MRWSGNYICDWFSCSVSTQSRNHGSPGMVVMKEMKKNDRIKGYSTEVD